MGGPPPADASAHRNREPSSSGRDPAQHAAVDIDRASRTLTQRGLLQASYDATAVFDADGELVSANEAFADLHGASNPEALLGESWQTLVPSPAQDRFEQILDILEPGDRWEGSMALGSSTGARLEGPMRFVGLEDGGFVWVLRGRGTEARHLGPGVLGTLLDLFTDPMILVGPGGEPHTENSIARATFPGLDADHPILDGIEPSASTAAAAGPTSSVSSAVVHGTSYTQILHDIPGSELSILQAEETPGQEGGQDLGSRDRLLDAISSHRSVVLFGVDKDGRFFVHEGGGIEVTDREQGELIGASAFDVYADQPELLDAIESALEGEIDRAIVKADDAWWDAQWIPELGPEGEVQRVYGLALDITATQESRRALKAALTRYEELFRRSNDGILLVDTEGRILEANEKKAEITGYTENQLTGMDIFELTPPGEERAWRQAFTDLLEDGQGTFDLEIKRADGTLLPVEISASTFELGDQRMILTLTRDITNRLETQWALEAAKESAEKAHEQTKAILESLQDGFVAIDGDWRYTYVNETAERSIQQILGTEEIGSIGEGLLGERMWDLFPQLEGSPLGEMLTQAMEEEEMGICETSSWVPDRWYEVRAYPHGGGLCIFFTDITERKEGQKRIQQAMEAAEEAQSLYENILESVQDGFVALDEDWCYTYVNEVAETWMHEALEVAGSDLAGEDLTGHTIWEIHPELEGTEHARVLRQAMEEREPATFEVQYPWTDRWVEIRAYPSPEGLSIFFRDVTERKEYNLQLQEAKETAEQAHHLYENILESIRDGFVALDEDWRYTYANQKAQEITAKVLEQKGAAVPPDGLVGQNIWELFPEFEETLYARTLRTVMEEREPATCDAEGWISGRWYEIRAYPSPQGVSVFFSDVTDRRKKKRKLEAYAEELERSNEQLQRFAQVAAHDLQEPVRNITSFVQLLNKRHGEQLGPDARELISYAVDAAHRIRDLIRDLLAYAHLDQAGRPFTAVDLEAVVESVLRDLRTAIEESQAEIDVGSLPTVHGDRTQLTLLIRNLLANAIKFRGDQPPSVQIRAERAGDAWAISVEDDGIGIAEDYQDKIFGMFQRLHGPGEYPGTGIGLTICRRVIERHGGEIEVESAEGEGATFTFTIPAVEASKEDPGESPASPGR